MKKIISTLGRGEKAGLICEHCKLIYFRSKRELSSNRINKMTPRFCSKKCKANNAVTSIKQQCAQCGQNVKRTLSQYTKSKTKNIFVINHVQQHTTISIKVLESDVLN